MHFFLDGAHTGESTELSARWFLEASAAAAAAGASSSSSGSGGSGGDGGVGVGAGTEGARGPAVSADLTPERILLFNCLKVSGMLRRAFGAISAAFQTQYCTKSRRCCMRTDASAFLPRVPQERDPTRLLRPIAATCMERGTRAHPRSAVRTRFQRSAWQQRGLFCVSAPSLGDTPTAYDMGAGAPFAHSLFVPSDSVAGPKAGGGPPDLQWQVRTYRHIWSRPPSRLMDSEMILCSQKPCPCRVRACQAVVHPFLPQSTVRATWESLQPQQGQLQQATAAGAGVRGGELRSAVVPSLREAVTWLRRRSVEAHPRPVHVLVGSSFISSSNILQSPQWYLSPPAASGR